MSFLSERKRKYAEAQQALNQAQADSIDTARFNHLTKLSMELANKGVTYGEIAQYANDNGIDFNRAVEAIYRERV